MPVSAFVTWNSSVFLFTQPLFYKAISHIGLGAHAVPV